MTETTMENTQDKIIFSETKEFIATSKNNKSAIYSVKENRYITDFLFDNISYIKKGNYFVVQSNEDIFLIDTKGNRKTFPRLCPNQSYIVEVLAHRHFVDDLHTISDGKKVGVIDKDGNMKIPFVYKTIKQYSEGLFAVQTFDDKEGYIDKDNNIVIPFGEYTDCDCFKEGKALVMSKEHGKVYINTKGEILEVKIDV